MTTASAIIPQGYKAASELKNDLDRYLQQVQSMLVTVSDDGQIETLGTTNLLNVLWVICDRVDDIKRASDKLSELSKESIN